MAALNRAGHGSTDDLTSERRANVCVASERVVRVRERVPSAVNVARRVGVGLPGTCRATTDTPATKGTVWRDSPGQEVVTVVNGPFGLAVPHTNDDRPSELSRKSRCFGLWSGMSHRTRLTGGAGGSLRMGGYIKSLHSK